MESLPEFGRWKEQPGHGLWMARGELQSDPAAEGMGDPDAPRRRLVRKPVGDRIGVIGGAPGGRRQRRFAEAGEINEHRRRGGAHRFGQRQQRGVGLAPAMRPD